MAALPEWTQRGLILGMTGGQQRVLDRVTQLQAAGAPVVAVWLQVRAPHTHRRWWCVWWCGEASARCTSSPRQRAHDCAEMTAGRALPQDWTGICNTSFAERVWWNWQLDTSLYPDWAGLATELSDRGVALLTCVRIPCVVRPPACAESCAESDCVGSVCWRGMLTATSTRFCPRTRGPRVPCTDTRRRTGASVHCGVSAHTVSTVAE
jgi:hypothetical protein